MLFPEYHSTKLGTKCQNKPQGFKNKTGKNKAIVAEKYIILNIESGHMEAEPLAISERHVASGDELAPPLCVYELTEADTPSTPSPMSEQNKTWLPRGERCTVTCRCSSCPLPGLPPHLGEYHD